jgi:hypothetical protein
VSTVVTPELDRVEVLVGELDAGQHAVQQRRLLHRAAGAAVGEALAAAVGLGQLVLVVPAAVLDQAVDVGAVGALGVAEHAQRRGLEVAAVFRHVGQRVLADEVLLERLVGAGGEEGGLGQQRICSGSRSRKMPDSVMTTSMRGRPSSASGISSAPASRP